MLKTIRYHVPNDYLEEMLDYMRSYGLRCREDETVRTKEKTSVIFQIDEKDTDFLKDRIEVFSNEIASRKRDLSRKIGEIERNKRGKNEEKPAAFPSKTDAKSYEKIDVSPEIRELLEDVFIAEGFTKYRFEGESTLYIPANHVPYVAKKHSEVLEKYKQEKDKKTKNDKRYLGRTKQIKVRFTPEEYEKLQKKIEKSGKKQGDFIREMLLEGQVKSYPSHAADILLQEEIKKIKTYLGKISGQIFSIMKATKEGATLTEEQYKKLEQLGNSFKNDSNYIRRTIDRVMK